MARKSYVGAAIKTTITQGLAASGETTIILAASTGWPTVSGGSTGFVVVVDPGLATEEKILCSTRSGTSCTIATRGYDGTSATGHSAGAAVWHVLDANMVDEANAHVNDTTRDDHTQYLNNTRHDITTRHAFGAALGTPGTPATVNTIATAGTAAMPARSDHVHTLDPNIAGDGLSISSNALTVNTDDATIQKVGDALQVVSGGITATHLAAEAVTRPIIVVTERIPIGSINPFGGSAAPTGWLLCDGTSYSTSTYADLFNVVGYTYGGTGPSFLVPNLKGRAPVGRDSGQGEFDTLGETGGSKTHVLVDNEMPVHGHSFSDTSSGPSITLDHYVDGDSGLRVVVTGGSQDWLRKTFETGAQVVTLSDIDAHASHTHSVSGTTGNAGADAAHNNLSPYLVINYIIKY